MCTSLFKFCHCLIVAGHTHGTEVLINYVLCCTYCVVVSLEDGWHDETMSYVQYELNIQGTILLFILLF